MSSAMKQPVAPESARVMFLTHVLEWGMRLGYALVPTLGIVYLALFQTPEQRFVSHHFHEFAIAVAILLSGFVAYVTWRCYRYSGEPFLLWVAQGLTGFTVIYLPHGALTAQAEHNMALFLLYGPASRIVMAGCLFIGLLRWGWPHDPPAVREDRSSFRRGLAVFLLIDIVIALIAYSPVATHPAVRLSMELGALALSIGGVGFILWRRIDTPLMWLYTIALAAFAQSSVSFLLARAWDHQWWLGHLIFAGGFFVLSYGVLQAFHTTRAFSTVYSLEEMMRQLEGANNQLALQAATDPLTGVANRRHFVERFGEELARRQRAGTPLSLLAVDIDHFKRVNDSYGHAVGDATLIAFTARVREQLRAADLVGRIGGEEFSVLLPDVGRDQASKAAERIRAAMANQPVVVGAVSLVVTVSVGVAEFGPDGETIESLMRVADERLYRAKAEGRNRVVAAAA